MEFILLIAVVIIVSAISAATKKKPDSKSRNAPPLSDIQRAFRMAAHTSEKQPESHTPPTPVYTDTSMPREGRTPFKSIASTVTESYTESRMKPMTARSVRPPTGIQPAPFKDEEKPATPVSPSPTPKAAHIPLFENQQDVVKAFIYSEILPPRRVYPPRLR